MGQASGHMLTSHFNNISSMFVLDMLDYKLWAREGFSAPGAFQTGKEVTNFMTANNFFPSDDAALAAGSHASMPLFR